MKAAGGKALKMVQWVCFYLVLANRRFKNKTYIRNKLSTCGHQNSSSAKIKISSCILCYFKCNRMTHSHIATITLHFICTLISAQAQKWTRCKVGVVVFTHINMTSVSKFVRSHLSS